MSGNGSRDVRQRGGAPWRITRAAVGYSLAVLLGGCEGVYSEIAPKAAAQPAVKIACSSNPDAGATGAVLKAATAFSATLNADQKARLHRELTLQNAIRWSNFPSAMVTRNGLPFADMDARQAAAAQALIRAAAGECGARLFTENQAADVIGHSVLPYIGPEHHYISFNAEPSATKPWMLMIGGHHLAYNFTFNGKEAGATPLFAGSDPARFTDAAGVKHEPMADQSGALSALAQAAATYPDAHLPGVFTDLVKSVVSFSDPLAAGGPAPPPPGSGPPGPPGPPGGRGPRSPNFGIDARYPQTYPTGTTDRGVSYRRLNAAQQGLVRRAIESYAELPGQQIAAPLLRLYLQPDALANTYVAISGDPKLVQPNAYVRIDGPRVWIELSVQNSLIQKDLTHFHSVWRDKVSDYGGLFKT